MVGERREKSRRFVFVQNSFALPADHELLCLYIHVCGWEDTMRLLVKWYTGRNRAHFRMLLSTSAVERLATDMLGGEQWVSVNLQPKDVDTIRERATNALAVAYLNTAMPDVSRRAVNATISGGTGCDLLIDLGDVVMS